MVTDRELTKWVIETFDPTQTTTVERMCNDALRHHGVPPYAAAIEASEKSHRVLSLLQEQIPAELPFEFSDRDPNRLIGKQRIRAGDSPETIAARLGFTLKPSMLSAIFNAGSETFEKICAAILVLSGAKEAYAGCTNDDGGIDIYGRIPLRLSDDHVKTGILHTAILQKSLLMLGQCKCYASNSFVGPGELREFYGAINDCLKQYAGNTNPPRHRVPETYYRQDETCISVFFTTAQFAEKALAIARSRDIISVDGSQIAQFLIHHRVAIITNGEGHLEVDGSALEEWAGAQISNPIRLKANQEVI